LKEKTHELRRMLARPSPPKAVALLAAAAVLAGATGWALASDRGSRQSAQGLEVRKVSFQVSRRVQYERILDLGGLSLRARCRKDGGKWDLDVTAKTAVDNAVLVASFSQKRDPSAFTAPVPNFDRSTGPISFLGVFYRDAAGTLSYSRPDGGQLTLTFFAAEGTAQGGCVFGGIAEFAS
jgi:hypothetical protein